MSVLGVDEAGRGPVVGPMVMAGVMLDASSETYLKHHGVRDSKTLSPRQRERLYQKIIDRSDRVEVVTIAAEEIDRLRHFMTLNEIEALRASDLIERFNGEAEVIYLDSPDVDQALFSKRIQRYLDPGKKLVSEHHADSNYVSVAAASIIAKVTRDAELVKLENLHGRIGTGYPHDADTISFLEHWFCENEAWPCFVRQSWDTVRVIEERHRQKLLTEF